MGNVLDASDMNLEDYLSLEKGGSSLYLGNKDHMNGVNITLTDCLMIF